MNLEETIKQSEWWHQAQETQDRHFDPSEGVFLADHLQAVHRNLRFLDSTDDLHEYFCQLRQTLVNVGQDPAAIAELLAPVALLHDIGKPREDKRALGEHPISGKPVEMRHPIVGVIAALGLLPENLTNRDVVLALIEEHATPYSWYLQHKKTGQSPSRKSWARLDRKIDPREDGTGIVLLSIFKLADIDGHQNVDDVTWFFEQGFIGYLREKGKWLPVPDPEVIQSLAGADS